MTTEAINTGGKWAVVLLALIGCFAIIIQNIGDATQAWSLAALIVGWVIRDAAGSSSTANAVRTIAATQPPNTMTVSGIPTTVVSQPTP